MLQAGGRSFDSDVMSVRVRLTTSALSVRSSMSDNPIGLHIVFYRDSFTFLYIYNLALQSVPIIDT
jgi:hypothetical protein